MLAFDANSTPAEVSFERPRIGEVRRFVGSEVHKIPVTSAAKELDDRCVLPMLRVQRAQRIVHESLAAGRDIHMWLSLSGIARELQSNALSRFRECRRITGRAAAATTMQRSCDVPTP